MTRPAARSVPHPSENPATGVAENTPGVAIVIVVAALALALTVVIPALAQQQASATAPADLTLGPLLWELRTAGPVRSTPLVGDGTVWVGSTDGGLYAIGAVSGEVRWRYAAGAPIASSPIAAGDLILVRDRAGTLHAVGRADGALEWTLRTGPEPDLPWGREGWDYVLPAPTVVGDRVLYPGGDGRLYALDAATGASLWRFDTGARLRARPIESDGLVLVGDGAGIFHALRLVDGSEVWSFRTDGHDTEAEEAGFDRRQIYAAGVVADGVVYVGSRDAQVYALDVATGERLWQTDDGTSGWVIATATVDGDRLLVARSSSARIRALDRADGGEVWDVVTGDAIFGRPVTVGDQTIVVNASGTILGLDSSTGVERWRYGLGAPIWAEPGVAGGRLYVGDDDGIVRAFELGERPAPQMAVFWDESLTGRSALGGQPQHAGIRDYFTDRGYRLLDDPALADFIRARVSDRARSVIVFAMDAWPPALGEDASLFHSYLEAGGKVVWLGQPPRLVQRDENGRPVALDPTAPTALLGVDHSVFVGDRRPVFPTDAGRRQGLESFWTGSPAIVADERTTVLAVTTTGEPVAWARSWGGPEGSGFVRLYASPDARRLDEIRRVVEHGIFRSPTTRTVDAR